MPRHSVMVMFSFGMALSLSTPSFAWDGQRKGFVLGIGAGGGLASYKPYTTFAVLGADPNSEGARENKFAVMTDFKIGYAPSNQVGIFWMSKVVWFGHTVEYNDEFIQFNQSYTLINGVSGLGVAYYFKPEGPSPYLTGGFGFSTFDALFEENFDGFFSSGIALGAGYEFSKHWSVEGNFSWGSPKNEYQDGEAGFKTWAARVTVNVLGY